MEISLELILGYLGALVTVLLGSWVIVPALTGLPWVPTHEKRIHRALEMANIQPGETLYDLGAGDGRVLIKGAKEFGARGIGIEISPLHCLQAQIRAVFTGVKGQVSIRWGNFYKSQLVDADVIFIYATSSQGERIGKMLKNQLRDGARVVSVSADIPNWMPSNVDISDLIFLYTMPPETGDLTSYLTKQKS